ncbi:MAG: DNA modification methylase [Caldilineaceae bacterium]|nr:DNA modification methylase [Caldilineaceae bacterium]
MSEAGVIQFRIEPDVWLPVADLLTMFHPSNSQTRSREELAAIKRHIADEGFTAEMIVVNPWNQKIVSGHGRTQALHELGYTGTVPVVYREYTSEADHRRALLRWNLARGHQDPEKQAQEFADLLADFDKDGLAADFGMEAAGFDALLAEWGEGEEKGEDPGAQVDRAEELRQVWGVEVGQLWKLGEHRLICGDCTDAAVVERVMDGEKARYGMQDPPYGISVVGGSKSFGSVGGSKSFGSVGGSNIVRANKYAPIVDDDKPYDPTYILSICPDSVLWGANYYADKLEPKKGWIVWDKKGKDWDDNFSDCELAWTPFESVAKIYRFLWMGIVQQGDREIRQHPTQKPVGLYTKIIGDLFVDDGIVIDFYLGSGTTLIACEQLNRKCRAVEISPAYVAVALQRWADMTGQSPVLMESA